MAASQYYEQIQQAYLAYYGRPADPAGQAYWAQQLANANGNLNVIINAFGTSAESTALYGGSNTVTQVNAIYEQLFGRQADSAGLAYYVNGINTGQFTLASVALNIFNGAQGADLTELQAKEGYADAFTAAVGQSVSAQLAYTGTAAANNARAAVSTVTSTTTEATAVSDLPTTVANIGSTVGQTVTLTTGVENVTASTINADLSPFFFNGQGPTLNAGDVINGTAGQTNNVLNITDEYGQGVDVIPSGVTINNIQTINLTTQGNAGEAGGGLTGQAGNSVFDVSAISGLQTVNVTSFGDGQDTINAASTTNVVDTAHNATSVIVTGGQNVTVNAEANGSNGSVEVQIGAAGNAGNANPSGAVTVNESGANVNGSVAVDGGTSVNVTISQATNSSSITVGSSGATAAAVSAPTGAVTISDAGTGPIQSFGGTTQTITSGGGDVTVGDYNAKDVTPLATGAISVTDTAAVAYNDSGSTTLGSPASVSVYGGSSVDVQTNTGAVTVGIDSATAVAQNTTGDVTVVDTATVTQADDLGNGAVTVYGGDNVTVTAAGGNVTVGGADAASNATGTVSVTETVATTFSTEGQATVSVDGGNGVTVSAQGQKVTIGANTATTGAVDVTQAGVLTGNGLGDDNGWVIVNGGTDVTVNTTGGNVLVGAPSPESSTYSPVTGAVSITDTFSGAQGANTDAFEVLGGTTVSIDVGATRGNITVGQAAALNSAGTALQNAAEDATGNVTINNSVTNGSTTTYGTGATDVYTNGATSVSVTGGHDATITDVEATQATGGINAGTAVGTSTLSSVTLDHVEGNSTITSDALTSLTLLNGESGYTYTIDNNTAGHALTLTLGGDATASPFATDTVIDNTAGSVIVTDNGAASGIVEIEAVAATTVTVENTAALVLGLDGDTALTSVTLQNTGSLLLDVTGDTSLASINASGASGAVSVELDPSLTSFRGGSGNDTVALTSDSFVNATTGATDTIVGGSGVNTLIVDFDASASTALAPVELGSFVTGFTNLEIASGVSGYFDATGFTGNLQVGDSPQLAQFGLGNDAPSTVYFENVAAGTTLTLASQADVHYVLAADNHTTGNALNLTIGVDGSATTAVNVGTGGAAEALTLQAGEDLGGIATLNIASQGQTTGTNYLNIADATATKVTITGDSGLTLGILGGAAVTSINASASSGAINVTGVALATSGATITGGAGQLTASGVLTADGAVGTAQVNTVSLTGNYVAGDVVSETINGKTYSYTVLAGDTDANIAGGLAAAITATGINVGYTANGTSFTLTANAPGAAFTSSATQTLVSDTGAISEVLTIPAEPGVISQMDTVTVTGNYVAGDVVTETINGNTYTYTVQAGDTAANIAAGLAGAVSTGEPLGVIATYTPGATSFTLTTTVLGDGFAGSATSTAGQTGSIGDTTTTPNSSLGNAVDTITTGTGGGVITIGAGGSNGGTGSETINLSASTGVVDTLNVNGGTFAVNNAVAGGVTGFQVTANASTSDHLTFETTNAATTATVLANVASAQLVEAVTNLDYTSVNGVLTWGAVNGDRVSADFTEAQLIQAAESIVTGAGADHVLAFVSDGNTYVVASDGHDVASVTELLGVTSVAGFGTTAAADTIVANVDNQIATSSSTGSASVAVFDETGFSHAVLGSVIDTGDQVAGTTLTTLNHLAASAQVDFAADLSNVSNVTTTQVGASGSNSLTLDFLGGTSMNTLTVNGDNALTIHGALGASITSLVDATNTVSSLTVTGNGLSIATISDTALTSIDAHAATGVTLGSLSSALTENSLSVTLGSGSAVYANGAGDSFTLGHGGSNTVDAYGANDSFVLGDVNADGSANGAGNNTVYAYGAGDTVTVNDSSLSMVVATGAGDTISLAADAHASVTVGSNAVISLGAGAEASITVTGDVTGGSSANFAFTTISGYNAGNDTITFGNATAEYSVGGSFGASQVNVAGATSLANALDLAASQGGKVAAHSGSLDWFQYQGNTYVVEAVNNTNAPAAHTALGANDAVVKLTGLVDLTHATFSSGVLHVAVP